MTPGILPLTLLSPPLKTSAGQLSRTKGTRGGTATLCHQALIRPSASATAMMPPYPASALSAMNVLAVDVAWPFLDLHFTKQSQEKKIILYYINWLIGLVGRVFANGPGDRSSIPGRVIPKILKMVLDTSLLNSIIRYVSRVKLCNPGVVAIEKGVFGSPSTMVANLYYII